MPPAYSNRSLTTEQIAILERWIREGGEYSRHWAFIPPVRPAPPKIAKPGWPKQPIDAFVWQRLKSEGLRPNVAAPPLTWLRRVSLDITGLPPSPLDLDTFATDVNAPGDAAYGAAVGRLLASPRFGERIAALARRRSLRRHPCIQQRLRAVHVALARLVIQSFNDNMPYDRFLSEQLAGDLLPNPTLDQRIATASGETTFQCRNASETEIRIVRTVQ